MKSVEVTREDKLHQIEVDSSDELHKLFNLGEMKVNLMHLKAESFIYNFFCFLMMEIFGIGRFWKFIMANQVDVAFVTLQTRHNKALSVKNPVNHQCMLTICLSLWAKESSFKTTHVLFNYSVMKYTKCNPQPEEEIGGHVGGLQLEFVT